MKLTSSKKIVIEDYPATARAVVERLASILNPFLDQVAQAVSRNLTLADNFKAKTYKITLPVGVSAGRQSWDLNEAPTAVLLGGISRSDGSALTSATSLVWSYGSGVINFTVLGLDASKAHALTLVGIV